MTYLELCQRLRQEVGAAGNGPANVAGQSGEYARFVGWVANAWHELQNSRHWFFDWATGAIELNSLDTQYELPADVEQWLPDSLTFGLERRPIRALAWDQLPQAGTDTFAYVALAPNGILHLNAPPDATGSLSYEYWRTPQPLVSNTDVPRMPERFHMILVYKAMEQYALYENAPEVSQQALSKLRTLETQLMESQLPAIKLPPGLA